jgi:hypothetical protein
MTMAAIMTDLEQRLYTLLDPWDGGEPQGTIRKIA